MSRAVVLVLQCLRSGGAEKQLLWIAAEICRAGYDCCVFELRTDERSVRIEAMVEKAEAAGVIINRASAGVGGFRRAWALSRCLRKSKATILWSWGLRADAICFLALGRWKSRWLISVRSANSSLSPGAAKLLRFFAARSGGIVSNTRAGLQLVDDGRSNRPARWVLPNTLSADSIAAIALPPTRPQRLILVMLGNIKVRIKGYDIAVQLARRLLDRGLPFELRIAGRPDEIGVFRDSLRQLQVEQSVKYCGEVSEPEKFLREGHLFLLLSRFEGMPNTLLEALQVGLPAIATTVGDLRELKDEGAPFELVPPEDVIAVEQAVLRAWDGWTDTVARARLGPAWVGEHFSEAQCRLMLRRILSEVAVA